MKYVLIIGAKSELGIELARLYAGNQYNLYLAGRSINDMQNEADYLERVFNIKVTLCNLDVTNFISHQKFYESMTIKPIGVIYAAGYYPDPLLVATNWEESANTINVNYAGAVSLLSIIAEDFYKYKSGFIIGIASVSGVRGRAKNYTYGSSKAALITYLSGLRNKLDKSEVSVLTVISGYIQTKKSPKNELSKSLVINPKQLATKIFIAQQEKKSIIYSSYAWKIIMSIIKILPESIFKKLNI
jgi:decaprenylphospho-beta-D-erythro-pentofuranosid-2-ulose 2-reductase